MADKNPNVTMRVRVGDRELEVTGPKEFVSEQVDDFLKQQGKFQRFAVPSDAGQTPNSQNIPPSLKKLSEAQFFKKLSPKTEIDRALVAAYYLEKFKNQESFTAAEIRETIRAAKQSPLSNPNDAVAKNVKKGLVMSAGDKEGKIAFVLTSDGEEEIESQLKE